jgi:hypothetical protein
MHTQQAAMVLVLALEWSDMAIIVIVSDTNAHTAGAAHTKLAEQPVLPA